VGPAAPIIAPAPDGWQPPGKIRKKSDFCPGRGLHCIRTADIFRVWDGDDGDGDAGDGTMTTTERKRKNSPSQPVGRWIRVEKRLAIYLRDSFTCLACTADLRSADPRDITLDHIIPKADGGSNKESNLYTCCRACNCSRQDKPLDRAFSKQACDHIHRNSHRDLKSYLGMAKAIINDKTGNSVAGKDS
jgi:hypothetical protein